MTFLIIYPDNTKIKKIWNCDTVKIKKPTNDLRNFVYFNDTKIMK